MVKEVRALTRRAKGALSQHLADQWTLPLALAVVERGGAASFTCTEMTEHATTNIGVIEQVPASAVRMSRRAMPVRACGSSPWRCSQ